jgi:alpha-galactosidase
MRLRTLTLSLSLLGALGFPLASSTFRVAAQQTVVVGADIVNLPDLLVHTDAPPRGIWVDSLDLSKAPIRRPRPARGQGAGQRPTGAAAAAGAATAAGAGATVTPPPAPPPPPPLVLSLGGVVYPHGLPLNVNSDLAIDIKGQAARFVAMVGIDDSALKIAANGVERPGRGSVTFDVWVDGKHTGDSGLTKVGDAPKLVSVDLTGAKRLVLSVNDGGDGPQDDTVIWGGALIVMTTSAQVKPETMVMAAEPAPSIASSRTDVPRLNYPRITGATPGRPFIFRIPASGAGPLKFEAKNLPAGVTLDPASGLIKGALSEKARTVVTVTVSNAKGKASAEFIIVAGKDALALTPPLGWNSWNVWGGIVTADHVRAAADGMVSSGLAAQGYTYINIDDAWEGGWRKGANGRYDVASGRDANGEIVTNEKFPDMKGLVDYIHGKGLKAGIYSGPGNTTCQGAAASYQHEEQDARTWAKWGFDYLKYDWCGYPGNANTNSPLDVLQKPYTLMRGILDMLDRDIVFSLCQYGWGKVWEWGDQVGGNLWRVTGDITDTWSSMSGIGFQQTGHEAFAGPGHWNDTDMLVVGKVGWGRGEPRPTQLTPNEQLTHISLWALQAAPLLIGADMSQLDEFTINLLGNPEVLSVNQDMLGKAAGRLVGDGRFDVWARPLSDGTMAVGLFNRSPEAAPVTVSFKDLELSGRQPVRDLWQHKNLADAQDAFTSTVPRHGVVFVKIGRAKG